MNTRNVTQKRLTMKDVAKYAGVSVPTVSRVIAGLETVSPENKKKVQQAISELNYVPNAQASNLRKRSSNLIGIIVPDITNDFFMKVVNGIQDSFEQSNYVFYLASSKDDSKKERAILRKFHENSVEAIVIATMGGNEEFIGELLDHNVKIITIDRVVEQDRPMAFVGEDNFESAYLLTKTFISQIEYNSIVLLGGYQKLSIGMERVEGAKKALRAERIHFEYFDGEFGEKKAQKLFKNISDAYPNGCGIVSLSSTMTKGLIRAIYSPDETVERSNYPIASYGQLDFQDIFADSIITSVKQYPYEIGNEIAKLLKKALNNDDFVRIKQFQNSIVKGG